MTDVQAKLFVAGGFSGVISKTVLAPLERIKILNQAGLSDCRGIFDTFRTSTNILYMYITETPLITLLALYVLSYIMSLLGWVFIDLVWRHDRIHGFWRGNLTNCIRVFPDKAALFACNDILKVCLYIVLCVNC